MSRSELLKKVIENRKNLKNIYVERKIGDAGVVQALNEQTANFVTGQPVTFFLSSYFGNLSSLSFFSFLFFFPLCPLSFDLLLPSTRLINLSTLLPFFPSSFLLFPSSFPSFTRSQLDRRGPAFFHLR